MKPVVFVTALAMAVAIASLRAETHRFAPTAFYDSVSASHPPALRIKSGDRVVTTTVDDKGVDAAGKATTSNGTLTGPFFVEGAEPGDLLVVTIDKLEPNRTTGQSTSLMSTAAVAAGGLQGKPDQTRFSWTIDKAKGVVRFDLQKAIPNVDWRTRYVSPVFEMPLRPMLASIGVAPAGAETPASGPFGGALVAPDIAPGAKVMLPVMKSGALLFLGHGHARQGDGNIGGTGIETSMDVEFSVEVVKKKEWPHSSVMRPSTVVGEFEQGWPRVETADYLMAVGSGASMSEALQRATLELHHWLDDDFGLSEKTVNIFVAQAIEYSIANIADPTVTVVAKVRKSYLPAPVAGTN